MNGSNGRTLPAGYLTERYKDLELAYIPGYLGSIWGSDVNLNEEIISMVFWSSQEALESSIPTSHKVKIARYQRAV